MRRTRNRKHRGGIWPFSNAPAANAPAPAPTPAPTPAANAPAAPAEEKPGFFSSLFGKKNAAPAAPVAPVAPNQPPPTGGKRKNKCNWKGGSNFMGAPVNYNQVQVTGGQPSERIMQYATTAGGRRKHRNKSHRNKSRRNKSRRNKSRRNKSRRNKSRRN
jgi:hypothetical protein